ncbi:MAG: hypothetical protein AMXMBFR61_16790 [Fimbriimonadales bacterium]
MIPAQAGSQTFPHAIRSAECCHSLSAAAHDPTPSMQRAPERATGPAHPSPLPVIPGESNTRQRLATEVGAAGATGCK